GLHLADSSSPTPFGNLAHLTRPVPDAAAPEVASVIRSFYDARPGGPFLVFAPWPITDLRPYGLMLVGHPPMMLRPAGGSAPSVDGLRIERVTTSAALRDFEQTLVEGYPAPELDPFGSQPRLFADAILDTGWHCY